jgi:predicted ferric reductase
VAETVPIARPTLRGSSPPARERLIRATLSAACLAFFVGNIVAIVWIWVANDNLNFSFAPSLTAAVLARFGALAGLVGAYLALIQVLLLARLPWLDRVAGFDRLTVWHRWNGYACLALVLAHTVMVVWGYAIDGKRSFFEEFWKMLADGLFPGMVTATIGTVLFVVVTVSSILIVRRHLSYELWYAVHLTAYAAIALAWFHEIPTGGELALNPGAALYWRVLFYGTLVLLLFRIASPIVNGLRFRLRVAEVVAEGPSVTSLHLAGRRLDRLSARPGQFFLWRFLAGGFWWTAHPFSLSAAPDGRRLRISVKASGDHTARIAAIPVGTRVVAEGPFGQFTDAVRRRCKVLLIAGGIGITPVRALAESMAGDLVVVHRVLSERDVVFRDELAELAARRELTVHYIVGDHAAEEGQGLLSTAHLLELVPDIAERDVYLCGPPGMVGWMLPNVRRAGVARRRLHVERFAL